MVVYLQQEKTQTKIGIELSYGNLFHLFYFFNLP